MTTPFNIYNQHIRLKVSRYKHNQNKTILNIPKGKAIPYIAKDSLEYLA